MSAEAVSREGAGGDRAVATGARRVGFQGEAGAFSDEAVGHYFLEDVESVPIPTFADAGTGLARGQVDLLLLPLENSLVGTVTGTLDVLLGQEVEVLGEVIRPIRHQLMAIAGTSLDRITRVISHPIALGQCASFFEDHEEIEAVTVLDTAGAAREVRDSGDPTLAAIAPRAAAERYGLEILAEELQDRADNQTRFLLIARAGEAEAGTGAYPSVRARDAGTKTALAVAPRNVPGALAAILEPIARRSFNVSMIESRPAGTEPWAYRFYVEFVGDASPEDVASIRTELLDRVGSCRVVGSFPRWGEVEGG